MFNTTGSTGVVVVVVMSEKRETRGGFVVDRILAGNS